MGPSKLEVANTAPIRPDETLRCCKGVISVMTETAMLYRPAPPMPWNARNTILEYLQN